MNGSDWCYPGWTLLAVVLCISGYGFWKRRFLSVAVFLVLEAGLSAAALWMPREKSTAPAVAYWTDKGMPNFAPPLITGISEPAGALGFFAWLLTPLALVLPIIERVKKRARAKIEASEAARAEWVIKEAIEQENSPECQTGKVKPAHIKGPHPLLLNSGLLETAPGAIPLGFACTGEPLFYSGGTHLMTFGRSEVGKNSTAQTPALCTYPGSALVIDPKGQLAAITTKPRQAMGQETANLNPYGVLGLPTACYNPLRFIDPNSLSFNSDCDQLAEGLVMMNGQSKTDHFDSSARGLVSLVIQWLVLYGDTEAEPRPKDLISVRSIISDLGDPQARRMFFDAMRGSDNARLSEAAARWLSDRGEVEDCINTANNNLRFLQDAGIERVLRNTSAAQEISFADMKRRGLTVYILIPSKKLKLSGRFLRLIVMSAMGELMDDKLKNPEHPVLFMLDEFAQLGAISLIEDVASISRDYKLKLWLILQNLPQLKKLYGEHGAQSLLSASGVVQYLGTNDETTEEYVSKRSGVMFESFTTTSKSSNNSQSVSGGSISSGESSTTNERERRVLRPQDVRQLDPKTGQYLLVPGLQTIMEATRRPYWEQFASDFYGPDPYHMTPENRAEWDEWLSTGDTYFHRGRAAVQAVAV